MTPDEQHAAPEPRRVLAARRLRLLDSSLYLVLDPQPGRDLEAITKAAIDGGVDIVQLRALDLPDDEVIAIGERLARLCHEHRVMFFVPDRPDLVAPIGADGVHIESGEIGVAEARAIAGPAALVGISAGTPEKLAAASEAGADYASVGPVHATPLKPELKAAGYRAVHHASLNAKLPWFAIGGIDTATIDRTLASGAERVAVVRAINEADDPTAITAALKAAIDDRPRRVSSAERDAAARADLRPFEPGERPAPAAIAAILVAAIALTNLLMLAIGYQPRPALQTTRAEVAQIVFGIAGVGLAVAVWHLKAWALLAMQAVLVLSTILAFAGLITAQTVRDAVLLAVVFAVSGALFYTLIRVLARAQTPRTTPPTGDASQPPPNVG